MQRPVLRSDAAVKSGDVEIVTVDAAVSPVSWKV